MDRRTRFALPITALALISPVLLVGCISSTPRNAEGGIEGTVESTREDSLVLRVGDDTIRVDTWGVCGDETRTHISVGDEITVFGSLDVVTYDATRILDAAGEPVCPG